MSAQIIQFPSATTLRGVIADAFFRDACAAFEHWSTPEDEVDISFQQLVLALKWERWHWDMDLDDIDRPDFEELAAQIVLRNASD